VLAGATPPAQAADIKRRLRDAFYTDEDGWKRRVVDQAFEAVGILRRFFSRRVPNGGDWSTVDVGPVTVTAPYEQRSVPGYRGIVDLSPANDSRFIESVGPSGHFLSKYYDAFQQDWKNVHYREMRMDRREIETNAIGHLRLSAAH